MSVLFLPPSAGAASVPDASETVKGIIRIATSAEATAGTDDLTSMTPAKTKSVVDAAVVGGVTYKGTFDAAAPLDLSNAVQGDLYIIDGAGTYQGKTWAVGDHLLVNADMGGSVDPAKIDKIDSTDSVTSVAGRTGAVVLSTADISGLATVATSGAYSDLSGTPTLATVATTGAYSDLSGTPSLATVATTGAYSDLTGAPDVPILENNYVNTTSTATAISENGHYAYWFNNTSSITLTIPAQGAGVVAYLTFSNINSVDHSVSLSSGTFRLSGGSSSPTLTIPAGNTRSFYYFSATYWELTSNEINELGDVTITSPSNGEALIYNSTSGDWENGTVSASVAALDDIGDVDTTGVSTNNVLKYDGANWVDGSVAYSEVSGTPTLATIATTGDYSDLNDSVVVQQFNATATASAISSNALHVFRLYGAGGFSLTLAIATVANGFALFHNISGSDVTVSGTTFRSNGEGVSGGSSSITVKAGERRLYYLESIGVYVESNSTLIGRNGDVTITSPSNGEALIYNSTSGDWENGTVSASVAALDDIGDVTITGVANTEVIKYNSTSGDWENGSVAYSEVTGTPTLATVATTGAYSDLSGLPTLGTAAAEDVGTSANNVVQLDGTAKLPAVDGSQLTNLPSGASTLGALSDVTITGVANTEVIKYNSTSGDWENGAVAYADVSGTPTLGTAAALDVGTSANNVVQLDGTAKLPAVDGSQLTNLPGATVAALDDIGNVDTTGQAAEDLLKYNGTNWVVVERFEVVSTVTTTTALTVPEMEQLVRTSGSGITLNLPNIASNSIPSGVRYQVKVTDSNTVTIAPNGSELLEGSNGSYSTSGAKESLTVVCDGAGWWFI